MLGRWVVAVLVSLCALQLAAHAEEEPPGERYHGHRVGTGYIAFYIGNRTDDWGCLGSVHVHNDDQPAPRGAGRPGQPSGIFSSVWAPTPLWQLNLSSCRTSDSSVSAGEEVVTSAQFLVDSESKLREATAKMMEALNDADESASAGAINQGEQVPREHQHD